MRESDSVERLHAPRLAKFYKPICVPVMQVDGPKAAKPVFIVPGWPAMGEVVTLELRVNGRP